jgi:hypothetical protein
MSSSLGEYKTPSERSPGKSPTSNASQKLVPISWVARLRRMILVARCTSSALSSRTAEGRVTPTRFRTGPRKAVWCGAMPWG